MRRTECSKIKISQSDFSNLKFGKNCENLKESNVSKDLILILAEYKNGRNMQNLEIVTDRSRVGTNFIFPEFRYERCKILLYTSFYLNGN